MRVLALVLVAVAAWGQTPRLLLGPQRLKRLERDRQRQTERWVNFERRVQTVPDSPERGFELALYFMSTQDEQAKRDALAWAVAHPCERRQTALIVNWLRDVPPDTVKQLQRQSCAPTGTPLEQMRDDFFWAVASGSEPAAVDLSKVESVPKAPALYALTEFLEGYRTTQFSDLRRQNLTFYATLPAAYLLSLRPHEMADPTWQQHIAALALVGLDPNLESSQFLQGWAVEERYMLRDGPGVAYELLWADIYLPGVGYQNMDPWLYRPDEGGTLLARTSWQEDACWVKIAHGAVEQENCPPDWQAKVTAFGHLDLLPVGQQCVRIQVRDKQQQRVEMVHFGQPLAKFSYEAEGEQREAQTDESGLWLVPNNVSGTICQEIRESTHVRRH